MGDQLNICNIAMCILQTRAGVAISILEQNLQIIVYNKIIQVGWGQKRRQNLSFLVPTYTILNGKKDILKWLTLTIHCDW